MREDTKSESVTEAISHATVTTANDLNAKAIITVTKGGGTARMLSKYRADCPIIGLTTDPTTLRQLSMSWGVIPGLIAEQTNTDNLMDAAIECALEHGWLEHGDLTVITAGVPLGVSGNTNLIKVETV